MKTLFICLFTLVYITGYAQQGTITGKITDHEGNTIPGINIYLKNTDHGTTTDIDGNYRISHIPAGTYELNASLIGFETLKEAVVIKDNDIIRLDLSLKKQSISLSEVIISASREKEVKDEIPSSVTILDSKAMDQLSSYSTTVSEILSFGVPGLAPSTNTTSNTGQTLRGRNFLVMIDGIPQSTPLRAGGREVNSIDPSAIERIEVIKGATSIYGNGADGGLINYITVKPTDTKPFSSKTTLSNTGALVDPANTMGGSINQQFSGTSGKFNYLINGLYGQTGVFKDANGEVISPRYGLGEMTRYALMAKVGYQLNHNHEVKMMYNYFSNRQDSRYIMQPGVYGESPAIGVLGEDMGVDEGTRYNHNAQLTYSINRIFESTSLDVNLYYQDFMTIYDYSTYFNLKDEYEGGQSTVVSTKKGVRANFTTKYNINKNLYGMLIYGVDILNDVTAQTLVDGRVWVPEMDMRNLAPYAQLKMNLFNDLVFKGGVRYENISVDVDDFTTIKLTPYGGNLSGGVAINGGTINYNAIVFNAGLRYNRLSYFKPFISFSQGFSIADLGRTLRAAKENTIANINSEAVIVNNYEVGFSSTIKRFNFEGYGYISTSELGSIYVERNGVYEIQRAPEKVYGFEAIMDVFLHKKLSAGGSFTWVEGMFDGNDDGDYKDEDDNYLPNNRISAPKATGYINYIPVKGWNILLQTVIYGSRERFEANENGVYGYGLGPVKGFELFNLATSVNVTEKVRLQLGIENLLNKDYYTPIAQWYGRGDTYTKGNGARYNLSMTLTL